MPATAGRVKMPHNNVMTTSSSLKSSAVWQNVIGYDPYAPQAGTAPGPSGEGGSAYENMRSLMALAKQTGGEEEEVKGQWQGKGKLRGGWIGVGQVEVAADKDAMPSSTDSESDSESEGARPPAAARRAGEAAAGQLGEEDGGRSKKRHREHKESKKKSKHKSDKHRKKKDKHRKEKKSHKRSRH